MTCNYTERCVYNIARHLYLVQCVIQTFIEALQVQKNYSSSRFHAHFNSIYVTADLKHETTTQHNIPQIAIIANRSPMIMGSQLKERTDMDSDDLNTIFFFLKRQQAILKPTFFQYISITALSLLLDCPQSPSRGSTVVG